MCCWNLPFWNIEEANQLNFKFLLVSYFALYFSVNIFLLCVYCVQYLHFSSAYVYLVHQKESVCSSVLVITLHKIIDVIFTHIFCV